MEDNKLPQGSVKKTTVKHYNLKVSRKNKIRHFQAVDDSYEDSDMGRMKMEQSRYSEKVSTCRRLKVVDYLSIQSSICAKNIMRTWLMSKIFRERIT